jgi:hypothetical protein
MDNSAHEWREAIIDLGVEVDTHQDGDVFIRTFTFNEAQLQAFLDQHSAHLVERIEKDIETYSKLAVDSHTPRETDEAIGVCKYLGKQLQAIDIVKDNK